MLVGLERGWREHKGEENVHVAGVRTFGLTGMLGALWAMLAENMGNLLLGFAFVAFAGLMITSHVISVRREGDYGLTTVVAALITFALGALAMRGYETAAAAVAVVTATLLGLKPILHSWVERLERKELYAIFKLLLISVVVLPALPDRGFGPWQALNPYEIWLMIVLIATISFVGYFAMKVAGPKRGLGLTGLFGGLISSTAVTVDFSKMGKEIEDLRPVLSAGILVASGTMFPRILLISSIVYPPLVYKLALPLGVMALVCYASAAWLWWKVSDTKTSKDLNSRGSFELKTAFAFGALLTMIMFLSRALLAWMGDAGLYLLAATSGLSDVDAITLSASRIAGDQIAIDVAARAIMLAAFVNTLVKAALTSIIGGTSMARYVGTTLLLAIVSGSLLIFILN
ncbi:MAG: MgtC/SapB family protein [Chlorobiales bacterium]|nr:MgtC/SapB family protein [Chlorobiales bacterium]